MISLPWTTSPAGGWWTSVPRLSPLPATSPITSQRSPAHISFSCPWWKLGWTTHPSVTSCLPSVSLPCSPTGASWAHLLDKRLAFESSPQVLLRRRANTNLVIQPLLCAGGQRGECLLLGTLRGSWMGEPPNKKMSDRYPFNMGREEIIR